MNLLDAPCAESALLSTLLAPVSDAPPCGTNLEYAAPFLALMQAAQPRAEQQYGDTIIAAEAPDWREVARQAELLIVQSKDLRIACLLAQAWTNLQGMQGYAQGLRLVAGLLSRYWTDLYPRLKDDDEDDEDIDPFPRTNALAPLFEPQSVLRDLRAVPLLGPNSLALREIESVFNNSASEHVNYAGGPDRLRMELARARHDHHPALLAVGEAHWALDTIVALLQEHLGSEWVPEHQHVSKLLQRITETSGSGHAAAEIAPEQAAGQPGAPPAPGMRATDWRTQELDSRDDVRLMLEKICFYLEKHEPSHPAPLLLRRAQRLMQMSFYDIMRDLAPDSVSQIDLLMGPQT
ncbi:type VI secretion system protein TssA [Massilia violaceinigra]|uniref:Type VI secretion system protein TssA n=1 Tax=Massilia violaceinigra TaxID=2045208 RepID=A0A2D2DN19_9BURK|nr:type VI secretion system protein TssA [Massilia violaceinigra]ATQ76388.1 type VI secretion system protein TssA [Massilia violaceinigra]